MPYLVWSEPSRYAVYGGQSPKPYAHFRAQAKNFIYIENQYFLGGSGEWQEEGLENICSQLIPIEVRTLSLGILDSRRTLEGLSGDAWG